MMGRLRVKSVAISAERECDSDSISTFSVKNINKIPASSNSNCRLSGLHCTAALTLSRSVAITSETCHRFHLLPVSDCSIGGQSASATTSGEPTIMIEKGTLSIKLCPTSYGRDIVATVVQDCRGLYLSLMEVHL